MCQRIRKNEQNLTPRTFYLPLYHYYRTHLPNELALKMDGAKASYLYSTIRSSAVIWWVGGREGCCAACGVSQSETAFSADLVSYLLILNTFVNNLNQINILLTNYLFLYLIFVNNRVAVANIQMRTLKTEVEKGSTWTAIGRGSADPKR